MVQRSNPSALYLRWLLVVYLPLGLLAIQLVLLPFGILPGWTIWLMVLLAAYAVPAVRLLIERRRSGLGVPLPRKIVASVAALSVMLALGVSLFVLGMGRLTTSRGLAMVYIGGCLMILSVTLPTFRLVDIVLRKAARLLRRALVPGKQGSSVQSANLRSRGSSPKKAALDSPPARRPMPVKSQTKARRRRAAGSLKRGSGPSRRIRPSGPPSQVARLASGVGRRKGPRRRPASQRAPQTPIHGLAVSPPSTHEGSR